MKKNQFFAPLIICIAALLCVVSRANALINPEQIYHDGRIDLLLDTSYYRTTSNFESGGSKATLPSTNYYQLIDVTPQIRYSLSNNLGFKIAAAIDSATSSDIVATRSNSSLAKITLGADYLFLDQDSFQTIFDFEYLSPIEKVSTTSDSVLNSDGSSEVKPTVILRTHFENALVYGFTGFNFRSNGLSSLVNYGLGLDLDLNDFSFGGDLKGFTSIINDKYTDQAFVRDGFTNTVNGGSRKFYSVNPNQLTLEGFLSFKAADQVKLKVYGGYDILGSNISQGYTIGATISLGFETQSAIKKVEEDYRPATNKDLYYPMVPVIKKNSEFREDTNDGVNQNLFKPVTPVAPPVQSKPQSNSEVKQQLDQIGYTIKLKKAKKKKSK